MSFLRHIAMLGSPILIGILATPFCLADDSQYAEQIEKRRQKYVEWIADNFGEREPSMDPRDGRRWALNHARLKLNRDVAKANGYFESFSPPPQDNDIYLIRFLRTLLDFRDSPRLSDEAEARIVGHIKNWPRNALSTRAHWPPKFTENHDLMYLTIGLFAEEYRDGDVEGQIREIKKFIAHRMERGFVEWNSKCYQYHFSNPLDPLPKT